MESLTRKLKDLAIRLLGNGRDAGKVFKIVSPDDLLTL
jgi:hypothetical protein